MKNAPNNLEKNIHIKLAPSLREGFGAEQINTTFTRLLMEWQQHNSRQLPWKNEPDAYKIWLSEIILQQTRVEQGLPYYLRFVAAYPTVTDLANAPQEAVMRLWEGLGYYSRARNMHHTAQYIAHELNGVFPRTYQELSKLKGVGAYTAAAIASFAYGLPYAVVDGNVYRVLARFFGIHTPIDSVQGKKQFAALAQELLYAPNPAAFNQAIMDFGSVQCKPAKPLCHTCPMNHICAAALQNQITELPVKAKKLQRKTRYFNYLVLTANTGNLLLRKRTHKDIWQHLYEPYLIETPNQLLAIEQLQTLPTLGLMPPTLGVSITTPHLISPVFKQQLTHQTIVARFVELQVTNLETWLNHDFEQALPTHLSHFAFPKIINSYWQSRQENAGKGKQGALL